MNRDPAPSPPPEAPRGLWGALRQVGAAPFYWLLLAVPGAAVPERRLESLSEEIAVVLAVIYLLSLVFTLVTHRDLFQGAEGEPAGERRGPEWDRTAALVLLLAATAGVAWMSEILVGTVE